MTQAEVDENLKRGGWRGRIKEQNTDYEFSMAAEKNFIRFTNPGDNKVQRSWVCVKVFDDDRYLVGQTGHGSSTNQFLCVQFLRRSTNVVQMRCSAPSDRLNVTLCLDEALVLDPWVLVNQGGPGGHQSRLPCSLRGGFTVRIYDRGTKLRVCDGFRGEIRIESDCFQGDGMRFYFRHQSCLPESLYMYVVQRVFCVASWSDGPHTFTLLRHDHLEYMWMLRFPVVLEDSVTAYLLTDLVADTTDVIKTSGNYFRLDVVRDIPVPVTSLCVDDGDVCSVWRDPCKSGPEMSLRCPRTCNVCNATRPTICRLPAEVRDHWDDGTEGRDRMSVEIDATTVTVTSGHVIERFHCIQWQFPVARKVANKFLTDHLLVSEFKDGCRPRYTCARILKKSTSVLFFRLSQSASWPLTSSPSDPIDCRGFSFPHDEDQEAVDPGHFRLQRFRLLYAKNKHSPVNCHLPSDMKNYHVTFRDGSDCVGRLVEAEVPTRFRLILTGCPINKTEASSFECLESSLVLPPSDILVVTGSVLPGVRHSVEVFCWFFLTVPRRAIYLVDAVNCDESSKRRILQNELVPLAALARFRRPQQSRDPHDVSDRADAVPSIVSDDNRGTNTINDDGDNSTDVWRYKTPPGEGGDFRLGQGVPNAFVLAIAGLLMALIQCAYFCGHS